MKAGDFIPLPGATLAAGLTLAVATALVCATVAGAQVPGAASADEAYPTLEAPSGPVAGTTCLDVSSGDGLLNAGDIVTYPGDFSVAPGASVVIEDADFTQGTLIDGTNAEISELEGGIEIVVTGDPLNVVGGDGVLSDDVCDSIVATTGISGGAGDPAPDPGGDPSAEGAAAGVLPETGGSLLLVPLGTLLAVMGAGILLPRLRAGGHGTAR